MLGPEEEKEQEKVWGEGDSVRPDYNPMPLIE